MNDLQKARVNKAGAYICMNGLYVFAIGIHPRNGHIPIVRLGGHCEGHETGWQCAVREVYEEANLHIQPLGPQTTFVSDWNHNETELQEFQWRQENEQQPVPFLVVTYRREESIHLSLMYLAHAAHGEEIPQPSSEVKGLILLTEQEIHRLCREPMTLEQHLSEGGKAILKGKFDTSLILEPFVQLRLLSRILSVPSHNKVPPNTEGSPIRSMR